MNTQSKCLGTGWAKHRVVLACAEPCLLDREGPGSEPNITESHGMAPRAHIAALSQTETGLPVMGPAPQMHSWPSKAQAGFQLPWTLSCPCAVSDSHHGSPGPRSPNVRKTHNTWQLLKGGPRHGLLTDGWSLSLPGPAHRELPFAVAAKPESHGRKQLPTTVVTLASPATSFRVSWWETPGITDRGGCGGVGGEGGRFST